MFEDTYSTIKEPSEGEFKDKGSKFIAYAYPLRSEEEHKQILAEVKTLHPKARHHCWAYRLTPDRTVFRVNDDGEPAGSAGRPILNVLLSQDVTNIFVVVVRYFGGTLLGVPGLINAYKAATKAALEGAEIIEKTVNDVYEVTFDYLVMNDVMKVVKEDGLQILNQQFDNECKLIFEVRQAQVPMVISKMEKIQTLRINFLHTI